MQFRVKKSTFKHMLLRHLFLSAVLLGAPAVVGAQDPAAARRLATTVQLAAEEYRLGVKNGRVIAAPEVEEARLFLAEARRGVSRLPASVGDSVRTSLDRLDAMVARI